MRILFLNHNLIWRGTFFRCLGFARELARRGAEVELWTCANRCDWSGERFELDGVRIWRTPRWGPLGAHDGGYSLLDNALRFVESSGKRWDVIHAFDHRPNVLLPWMWLKFQARFGTRDQRPLFVSDWCDWWTAGGITTARRPFAFIDRIEQRIEEGSKRISDGVTVISDVLRDRALDAGVSSERLLTLPAGVATERFPLLDRAECRAQLGLPDEAPLLGFIGLALWDLKLLADVFERVKQRRPDAVLLVAGGGAEAGAMNVLTERFEAGRDLIMPGVIEFSDVPCWLGACDALLLPMQDNLANRARVPNKLADYHAAGRPVVASRVGEAARWIVQFGTGLTARTADEMAECCLNLVDNPMISSKLGRNGRLLAEHQWSYAELTACLLDFYQRLGERNEL